MKDTQKLQLIVSAGAFFCLLTGWLKFFSPEINELLYHKIFYVLIGASFALQAPSLPNKMFTYPLYFAALCCVVGIFIPEESPLGIMKTVGLFGGVLISLFNRPKQYKGNNG